MTAETMIERYGPAVLRFLKRQSPEYAEDLWQETMCSVVLSIRAGTIPEMPLPWMYTIAKNKLLESLRRRRCRADFAVVDFDLGRMASPALSPENDLIARERCELLNGLIRSLRPGAREILARYIAGQKYGDIAASMGMPLHAVKNIKHRSVLRLARKAQVASV